MPKSSVSDDDETQIEWTLGFVEEARNSHELLRHKFRSKVGGRPAWLNPVDLPTAQQLSSKSSKQPLNFLLQIYCPVDDNSAAFHRMIYVFIPDKVKGIGQSGAVRAFRCQLPRENKFYASEPSKQKLPPSIPEEDRKRARSDPWRVAETEACLASNQTPPEPQGRHLYPEKELVTDYEDLPSPEDMREVHANGAGQASDEDFQEGDVTPDVEAAIASATSEEQKHFAEFAARVSWNPDQVLRYCFADGAEPLWPSASPVPDAGSIPNCPHCSGPRRFEFEVLPQLLNCLNIDHEHEDALDWGAIAVYSCVNSCQAPDAYVEEFVFVQPP